MQHLNSSTGSNITHWTPEELAASGIMGLCFLFGIPGNVAVVVVILRHFKKDNFTLHLMLNMAASDILCLSTLLLLIYDRLYSWTFGLALCQFTLFLVYCSLTASVLTIMLMSVQRYLVVLYPCQWAKLGRRGERALLCILWALACVLPGPSTAMGNVMREGANTDCWRTWRSDEQKVGVLVWETLMVFVAPFSILVTSYFCLHKRVNQTAFFRDKRMTRLVTNIVVTFFIFWVPYHLLNLLDIVAISLISSYPDISAKMVAFEELGRDIVASFTFINSCVNPFLYAFAARSLRRSDEQPERVETRIQCV